MRRGCISSGQVKCDECQRFISHPERYLAIDGDGSTMLRICVDCAVKKGYACYTAEKGEQVLTFVDESLS